MVENGPRETPPAPAGRRAWRRSLVLGTVILLCGMAIGSVITAVVVEPRPVHGMRRSDRLPERIVQEMQEKYNLTDEQKRQLLAIFEEHGKKLSDIRAEVQPRVDAEHEALRRGVEAVLKPEQAEQWRKEFEQMRRPWRPHGGESPGSAERR
jgi:Spy/CpxP family protein refolding chaperone